MVHIINLFFIALFNIVTVVSRAQIMILLIATEYYLITFRFRSLTITQSPFYQNGLV